MNSSEEQTPKVTLSITDETDTSQSYQLDYVEGENLYEMLNRAALVNPSILVEFDVEEQGEDIVFIAKSLNGYDPSVDRKKWTYKLNEEKTETRLIDLILNEGDQVSFEIE